MRLAILGATSQLAKDLVQSFAAKSSHELVLFARRPDVVSQWLTRVGLASRYAVADFAAFSSAEHFDAILNFVGVGDPAQAAAMGAAIFDVTLKYDELALDYLRQHPACRYIFLSSGAAYGASFDAPVDANTKSSISINNLQPQDWYAVAKLHAECRHRAMAHLPIVDIRVFNYFSHTQDMNARFLITDIVRAIRDKTVLKTSSDNIARDYLHPSDFFQLVSLIFVAPSINTVVDCYSKSPVHKKPLLDAIKNEFGLNYEVLPTYDAVNALAGKNFYYSRARQADIFNYKPDLTSLDGVISELILFFKNKIGY
jgi:nucleoside-diphosphate-sugar epimerase